jgi:hypothetical protein
MVAHTFYRDGQLFKTSHFGLVPKYGLKIISNYPKVKESTLDVVGVLLEFLLEI